MKQDEQLHGNIVVNLFRCSNLLERLGRKLAAEAGLTSVHQWFILSALADGELSLKQLGLNAHVTKQNMTGMIERLKQGGLVATCEDPEDRRVTRVRLTDKGRQVLARLDSFDAFGQATTLKHLCTEDLSSLNRCLQRLIDHMNDG
ncbi:MarR family winged helix-turn-helix transcriptional regulator [Cohnella cellulosilytica]|uniref:MarR family winged helix-turn-helix transcriptional regulator n=1 Tax=Cohnella cellulosilytica TaxID=986710 RepID=A0ABW2F346_9BACL